MSFLRVHTINDIVSGRLYDHSSGRESFVNPKSSKKYFLGSVSEALFESDYFIAISWGENGEKILDIFGYSGVGEDWKANPGVRNWVVRNGLIIPNSEITCGEGLVLLGKEEEHRLKTKGLGEYLEKPLNLQEINRILARR